MANLLSSVLGGANAVRVGGSQALLSGRPDPVRAGLAAGASIIGGGSVKDALGAAVPSLGAVGFGGLLGGLGLGALGGSKPKALHTEYAKTSANWEKPYGSGTDIVFYLQRADEGSNNGSASAGTMSEAGSGFGSPPCYTPVSAEGQALAEQGGGYFEPSSSAGSGYFTGTDWTPISQ